MIRNRILVHSRSRCVIMSAAAAVSLLAWLVAPTEANPWNPLPGVLPGPSTIIPAP